MAIRQPTTLARAETLQQEWLEVDASDQVIGRLSTRLARILQGKHKPSYTAHVDTGDYVVVTNVEKIRWTGARKGEQRQFWRQSTRPGHTRSESLEHLFARKPDQVLRLAVRRMLPKTTLGKKMLRKLKIVKGPHHPFAAQKPRKVNLGDARRPFRTGE